MAEYKCPICGKEDPGFAWTDTHGVAQCTTCGSAVRLMHYDDDNKRVEKGPESTLKQEYVPVIRAYWEQNHKRIPGSHSFPGGQELATQDEADAFHEWMRGNADAMLAERAKQ